jgi:hypothetical protein
LSSAFLACGCSSEAASDSASRPTFSLVTFNTGMPGVGGAAGDHVDEYGNGLAWLPLVEAAQTFFQSERPDVAFFQEIFHPEECANVTPDARPGFVCESWQPGDPTVAQTLLGPDYQVACHLGKPDKCIGVKKSFASLTECDADLCLDGLAGAEVSGCGGGSRIGRGVVQLARDGSLLTLVNVHGTSGITQPDQDCRVHQFQQVFEDLGLGDGPGVNGERNLVAGDLNTDPGRMSDYDESAAKFGEHAGPGKPFSFVSAIGPDAPPTYGGLFNIDHVVSDALPGDCHSAGDIADIAGFDHEPLVCRIALPE